MTTEIDTQDHSEYSSRNYNEGEPAEFQDLRGLVNYISKALHKFNLGEVQASVTINDVKYEVKVAK